MFIDEIHRFNKSQQDAFLPYVERGSIILIGATTENPSFEINAALLSRTRVFVFKPLTSDDLKELIHHALIDKRSFNGKHIQIGEDLIEAIAEFANGDARSALNTLEICAANAEEHDGVVIIDEALVLQCVQRSSLLYDKKRGTL